MQSKKWISSKWNQTPFNLNLLLTEKRMLFITSETVILTAMSLHQQAQTLGCWQSLRTTQRKDYYPLPYLSRKLLAGYSFLTPLSLPPVWTLKPKVHLHRTQSWITYVLIWTNNLTQSLLRPPADSYSNVCLKRQLNSCLQIFSQYVNNLYSKYKSKGMSLYMTVWTGAEFVGIQGPWPVACFGQISFFFFFCKIVFV